MHHSVWILALQLKRGEVHNPTGVPGGKLAAHSADVTGLFAAAAVGRLPARRGRHLLNMHPFCKRIQLAGTAPLYYMHAKHCMFVDIG